MGRRLRGKAGKIIRLLRSWLPAAAAVIGEQRRPGFDLRE
jgi:hypothetical protein